MKRTLIAAAIGFALSAALVSNAAAELGPFSSVNVAPKLALPDGDSGLGAGFGVEGIGHYDINDKLVATGTVGFLYFLEDAASGWAIPIMAGAKYTVMPNLFVGAELGIHYWSTEVDLGGFGTASSTSTELQIAPQVGYTIGKYTVVGQYVLGDVNYLGVRVEVPFK